MASTKLVYKFSTRVALAICAFLSIVGCSATSTSIAYSRSEVGLIPGSALQRLASAHSASKVIVIKTTGSSEQFEVKEFKDKKSVVAVTPDGNEITIDFSKMSELIIKDKPKPKPKQVETNDSPRKSSASELVYGAGEVLIYLPLIPVAIVSWPLLRAMGLDEHKNNADEHKAELIYIGLSKNELLHEVGEPKEKYVCQLKGGPNDHFEPTEIWIYENDRVLRGGRALFIDIAKGVVGYNSHHTTFFLDSSSYSCSALLK